MEKAGKHIGGIPEPTLRRLPKYIDLLKELQKTKIKYVSSNFIADKLNLDSIQVRKDLAVTGIIGKPKLGFDLDELIRSLNHTLNWDNLNDAFLVGVGSLGSAIIGYSAFSSYGLNIVAAFDNDPQKVKKTINGIEILPVTKLAEMIRRMKINIGILTVPAESAQAIAEEMVEAGIKAIWNFAPIHLSVNKDVIIENLLLTQSLGLLTHKLSAKLKKDSMLMFTNH
ncbi:MAG: CoA-binding domain protein [Ignavibacteria bacterium]|nr:MAG: CoA-binding domain protein [Ignavibacteria bacterium]KAF0157704.1 MAG: CoA-binding domain protein [Ignavibacteria bacterium]